MKDSVENYEGCNAMQSLMRARTTMLASFERHQFDRVTWTRVNKRHLLKYSTVKSKHILAVVLCFAKIFRESCVEKYKNFNRVEFSLTRARMKFEAGMNSPNLPWHVNITSLKYPSRFKEVPCFQPNHSSNHGLKVDFYISFLNR